MKRIAQIKLLKNKTHAYQKASTFGTAIHHRYHSVPDRKSSTVKMNKLLILMVVMGVLTDTTLGQCWSGRFLIRGNCDSSRCCCRSGVLTISRYSSWLSVSSDAINCPSSTLSSTYTFYGGYILQYVVTGSQTITLTLNFGENSISITNNLYSYCNDVAVRAPYTSAGRTLSWNLTLWFASAWILTRVVIQLFSISINRFAESFCVSAHPISRVNGTVSTYLCIDRRRHCRYEMRLTLKRLIGETTNQKRKQSNDKQNEWRKWEIRRITGHTCTSR